MSSSERITQSKGQPEGLSLPDRTRQRRKPTNKETQPDMAQQSTSDTEEVQQLQQQAVVQLSPLSPHHTRPTSSQSTTGPSAGERPPSRAPPVAGAAES